MKEDLLHDHESFKSNIEKALVGSRDLFTLHEAASFCDKYVVVDKKDWETANIILNSQLPPEPNQPTGIKYDSDKPRFDLIPADALEEVAKVYAHGAKKYGDRNWEKGLSYGRLYRALLGHIYSWWKGERDDKESKCHHLSAVIFNALGLLHYELNSEKFKKFDDRK